MQTIHIDVPCLLRFLFANGGKHGREMKHRVDLVPVQHAVDRIAIRHVEFFKWIPVMIRVVLRSIQTGGEYYLHTGSLSKLPR